MKLQNKELRKKEINTVNNQESVQINIERVLKIWKKEEKKRKNMAIFTTQNLCSPVISRVHFSKIKKQEYPKNRQKNYNTYMSNKYAQIWVDHNQPSWSKEHIFTYIIPLELINTLSIGSLVKVNFGNLQCRGIIIELLDSTPADQDNNIKIKPILEYLNYQVFTEEYVKFLDWFNYYYLANYTQTLKSVLPLGLLSKFQERVFLLDTEKEHVITELLKNSLKQNLSVNYLKQKTKFKHRELLQVLNQLEQENIIERKIIHQRPVKKRTVKSKKIQQETNPLVLNQEQKQVVSQITQGKTYLIHGVTGSGKTEVYFSLIQKALDNSQQVIFLLPEIALTTQIHERFTQRFDADIIHLWHSNLSNSQRLKAQEASLSGEPLIILGVRSAVFAPVTNLGLIIIDEEHDLSYKSTGKYPYYDARTVAKERALIAGATVVMGSATPSITEYYHAKENKTLLELNNRYHGQTLPQVNIINMKRELQDGNKSIFSRELYREISEAIERKEQIILLLNRRGYASHVFCRDCGHVFYCDNCSVPAIFHADTNKLTCHHCATDYSTPTNCPECKSTRIKQSKLGTQQLEERVKKIFTQQASDLEVLRLDHDISKLRHGVSELWERLSSHDNSHAQIIVGTQLVAKGIDLPNLTLVGIIQADGGLYFPDFITEERSFQLLTQVAGRAGRHHKSGKVICQTFNPEHPVIQLASQHDYTGFYEYALEQREIFNYPPFSRIVRVLFSSPDERLLQRESKKYSEILADKYSDLSLLGPAPCPLERINKRYRYHLLIKLDDIKEVYNIQQYIISQHKFRVTVNYDIDALNLM